MRKFLCLILSLCMVLCLAVPASAVTVEDEIASLVRDYLKRSASVKYNQASYDLTEWTVSELSRTELEKAQKHLENSVCNALAPMIEIQPNIGNYLDEKAEYIQYTRQRENLTVTNFSVVYGAPEVISFQGLATVTYFETVGMRYPGLDQDSAVSTEYVVDLVETESGWKISNIESDDLFDQTHDIDSFDLETAIEEYNALNGIEHPFVDVPEDSYYEKSVVWAYEQGITSGTTATSFSPNLPVTRAQFVVMLWRLEGEPLPPLPPPYGSDFDIDPETAFYFDAVMWAAENGIVQGIGNNQFGADLNIKREELVVMLKRYYDYKNGVTDAYVRGANALSNYTDADKISAYAVDAMDWAVSEGLIKGKSDTLICPKDSTTRAEAVVMLQRFAE